MTLKISSRLLVLARIVKDQKHDSDSRGALPRTASVAISTAFFCCPIPSL